MVRFSAGRIDSDGLSKGETSIASPSVQYTLFIEVEMDHLWPQFPCNSWRAVVDIVPWVHAWRSQENNFAKSVCFYVSFLCLSPSLSLHLLHLLCFSTLGNSS